MNFRRVVELAYDIMMQDAQGRHPGAVSVSEETKNGAVESVIANMELASKNFPEGALAGTSEEEFAFACVGQLSGFLMGVEWERSRLTRAALTSGAQRS